MSQLQEIKRQDITSYGDDELILIVENNAFLYEIRYAKVFPDCIESRYIYIVRQWTNLVNYLQDNK